MLQRTVIQWCLSIVLVVAAGAVSGAAAQQKKTFPKGSEKAIAAIRDAFPKAEIDTVAEPKGFGGSGGKGTPLLWTVGFHTGEKKHNLSVTPEGIIIRLPVPVTAKDLPKVIAEAVAKAAPGATIKSAVKNEMRATMKYVALDKAIAQQYAIEVVKDKKRSLVKMNASGGNVKVTELTEPAKAVPDKNNKKEIDIPAKAAKSVKAIKALYPDAVVVAITTEVFDDGSGTIGILTYEIEFFVKGKMHEMVASPEGVIPHLWAPIAPKALPKVVTDALAKAAPGAEVKQAKAFEIRAGLRFAALEAPKVYYTIIVVKDGKDQPINVKADGSLVKKIAFPKK